VIVNSNNSGDKREFLGPVNPYFSGPHCKYFNCQVNDLPVVMLIKIYLLRGTFYFEIKLTSVILTEQLSKQISNL